MTGNDDNDDDEDNEHEDDVIMVETKTGKKKHNCYTFMSVFLHDAAKAIEIPFNDFAFALSIVESCTFGTEVIQLKEVNKVNLRK